MRNLTMSVPTAKAVDSFLYDLAAHHEAILAEDREREAEIEAEARSLMPLMQTSPLAGKVVGAIGRKLDREWTVTAVAWMVDPRTTIGEIVDEAWMLARQGKPIAIRWSRNPDGVIIGVELCVASEAA